MSVLEFLNEIKVAETVEALTPIFAKIAYHPDRGAIVHSMESVLIDPFHDGITDLINDPNIDMGSLNSDEELNKAEISNGRTVEAIAAQGLYSDFMLSFRKTAMSFIFVNEMKGESANPIIKARAKQYEGILGTDRDNLEVHMNTAAKLIIAFSKAVYAKSKAPKNLVTNTTKFA